MRIKIYITKTTSRGAMKKMTNNDNDEDDDDGEQWLQDHELHCGDLNQVQWHRIKQHYCWRVLVLFGIEARSDNGGGSSSSSSSSSSNNEALMKSTEEESMIDQLLSPGKSGTEIWKSPPRKRAWFRFAAYITKVWRIAVIRRLPHTQSYHKRKISSKIIRFFNV